MNIQFVSNFDEAQLEEAIAEETEVAALMAVFTSGLDEEDYPYGAILTSFDGPDVIRMSVEYSPYYVILDGENLIVELHLRDIYDEEILTLDGEYDFDEDGVMTVVDIILGRVLDEETDASE